MRLIDADLLKKNIAKWLQGGDPQETVMVELDDIAVSVIMEIDEQPTACDVEEVVSKLQELAEEHRKYWSTFDDKDSFGAMRAYENAIKIVKGLDI